MTHPESNSIVHKLFSLTQDQEEIKFQDLATVINYDESNNKSAAWDILELYRGLYTANTEQKSSTHLTVSDAANSLSDQIATYHAIFNNITQAIAVNKEASSRVIPQVYDDASKIDRLKYKLFLERMRKLTTELTSSFTSALNEMEQIDKKHRKSIEYPTVCGLPQEIWFKIFNFLPQDLYGSFIRATCFSFNIIIRELKASLTILEYQSQRVSEIMSQAAANGQLSYVKFLHGVGRKLTQNTMNKAASSGNIELVKFIRELGVDCDWLTVHGAATSGNFEVFSYAREHAVGGDYVVDPYNYTASCLQGGNIEIIKTIFDEKIVTLNKIGDYSRNICSSYNAKAIMQLLIDYGAPYDGWKIDTDWTWFAVHNPNSECLKYLIDQGFELHPSGAAVVTTLECVQYLFELGFKNPALIENAAGEGKLDILKFGHEVCLYPLTSEALVKSIESKNYSCFEYLMNNNCQIVAKDVWRAVGHCGDERHVKLLFAKKVEFDPIYFENALSTTSKKSINRTLITWVVEQGVQLPENICDLAAQAGHLELLMYVHSVLHKPFGKKTVEKAAESFPCLQYVLENGADMSEASNAMLTAGMKNDVPSLALLLEHNCPIPEYFEMCLSEFGAADATEGQKDIKYQDLAAVMNYNQPSAKSTAWDILELYRGLYPANTEQKNINSSHLTVSDAADSLSDQIATYKTALNNIYQVIDANKEASDRVISQVYEGASKLDQLKYKLFLERMKQLTTELTLSFDSVLNEMEQIDKKHPKSYEHAPVCSLPREIWVKIFNLVPQQDLYGSFIRATCFSFNVIMRELKASSSPSQYQSQTVSQIMSQAAANGQLSYVKFLHGVGRKLTPDIMAKAATSGNIELVKFIHEQGVNCDWPTVHGAAKSGNFELFSYTREHVTGKNYDFDNRNYTSSCLEGGNIDIIKFLLDSSTVPLERLEDYTKNICSRNNAKEFMQLLVEYGAPIEKWKTNTDWTWHAANNPNIECLKYLLDQGFEVHSYCSAMASTLDRVKYLFERGFKNPALIENAVRDGKLDILKFGYEVCHYPLTNTAFVFSIEYDYTCFEYLINNNCPMVAKDVWRKVGSYGDERHVKLLFSKKVEFDPVYFEYALDKKGRPINRKLITWVVEQGVQLPENICDLAAKAGHLDLLKYFHQSLGKPFGKKTVENAAESFPCLQYVIENGADMSEASNAMLTAGMKNDVPSLALLLEHNCPIPQYFEMCLSELGVADASKYYYDFIKRNKK